MKLSRILPAAAAIVGAAALIRTRLRWRELHMLGVRRIVELQHELAEARRIAAAWQRLAAEALKKAATLDNDAEPEQPREDPFARYHPERVAMADDMDLGICEVTCPECGKYDVPCFAEPTGGAEDLDGTPSRRDARFATGGAHG